MEWMASEFVRERMGAYFCFIYIVVAVVVCNLNVERIARVSEVASSFNYREEI